jgi:hypothetical protein
MSVDLSLNRRRNVPLLNDPLEADDNDADHQAPTDMLNAMMLCDELFHTSSGVAFADFITDGHRETLAHSQQTFQNLGAALLLPRDWGCPRRVGARPGARSATAVEGIIDADPIATCVRLLMSERSSWTGSAADLLRVSLEDTGEIPMTSIGWPKNPRALAGRLRRAQTFLRALGIDIAFSREGRAGSRVIRMRTSLESTVSTVSTVSSVTNSGPEAGSEQQSRGTASPVYDENGRLGSRPIVQVTSTAADDADATDAKAHFLLGKLG